MTQDIEKVVWIDMLAQTAVYDYAKSFDVVYCGYVMEEAKSAEGIISINSKFIYFFFYLIVVFIVFSESINMA